MRIEAKPYKLINSIQNYDWGTKGENAFIPGLLGIDPEPDLPYAELWVGVHPKAPSNVLTDSGKIPLPEFIKLSPNEVLGNRIASEFNNTLPFLLKVLSANQALSIQAHPDKSLAKILNEKDPKNYPDDNHKPEIAIAADNLIAIAGFRPFIEIKEMFSENPELYELLDFEMVHKLEHEEITDEEIFLKEIYSRFMNIDEKKLIIVINQLLSRIQNIQNKTERDYQFIEQYERYGYDVGLLSIFLFNLIELDEDEAIYTGAGIAHAYIKGNLVECMANSDNVVRAGLTPKFKDVDTLLSMIDYKGEKVPVIKNEKAELFYAYNTPAKEFELSIINSFEEKNYLSVLGNKEIQIFLVMKGELEIEFDGTFFIAKKGDTVLIPATLENFEIKFSEKTKLIVARVPK